MNTRLAAALAWKGPLLPKSPYGKREREYGILRRARDVEYRLLCILRNRLRAAVKAVGAWKSTKTQRMLGCTISEFRAHIEAQFKPGMTWENYGSHWHIDHIKPCAAFDLLDMFEQAECFHYTNMQPLWAEENWKKGDTWKDPRGRKPKA